jgi:hypothetical protein
MNEKLLKKTIKKNYNKPAVIVHGTVEAMTRGGIFPGGRGSSRACRNISGHGGMRTLQCGS